VKKLLEKMEDCGGKEEKMRNESSRMKNNKKKSGSGRESDRYIISDSTSRPSK
jgi:hypothetical protein